jgi:hypothetical protein
LNINNYLTEITSQIPKGDREWVKL